MMQLERKLVEEPVIENLQRKGWRYVEAKDLKRVSIEEPLLIEDLRRKIFEINEDVELTDEDVRNVITKLQGAFTDQNGHKEILRYFKYGVSIKTEKERVVKDIQLFDYSDIGRNDFVCANQVEFLGRDKIRLDVLLFVNGIPLVNIECKNPYTGKEDYFSAYRQIKRYEKTVPELYKYVQIGVGFAEKVKYFPIVPWVEDVKQEVWRWEGVDDGEAIFEMLKPEVLLDILRNFIFVWEFRGEMTKVIGRYMQYRAVNKIFQRVRDNLEGRTDKNKGLIWHWQGSGKTLTMIFSAYKLYNYMGKPTIFFIVDRKELEDQFDKALSSLDLNFGFEKVESIEGLREILVYDSYRGKRGVFLTLIHKFNLDEEFILEELLKFGQIGKRKDVVCFLDEVHRSQYGVLALKMRQVLANAFFFGFTGTPISYRDRNTYKEFGYIREGDPELYLDRYFIDEAERDGFVVPIVYELRKEEVNLRDKDLEWYLKKVDVEDISDEVELVDVEERVKRKINEITVFLENPKNIEVICEDIAGHFWGNFDGKFKGLIVTGSRRACVRFKKVLDGYLDPSYSEVVMTFKEDDEEISEYMKVLRERYGMYDVGEIVKRVIDRFRKEEYPKLLIVTDMLITGFDEPRLGVLYLYKILKGHRLLQTIARVNRPYEQKPVGLLVDYVGVFKHIQKALEVYSKEDVEMIRKRVMDRDKEEEEFMKILGDLERIFGGLVGKFDKGVFDRAIEILKVRGDEFVSLYVELRKRFEFLRSEGRILKVLQKYRWFSVLYEYYKRLLRPDIDEVKLERYFRRTIDLIHNLIEPTGLLKLEPRLIDLEYIKKLKGSAGLTEAQRYVGVLTALKHICILKGRNPIYKSIAQRVRELVERWQGGVDIMELSGEIDRVLDYINEKEVEREQKKLDDVEFGIKLIFEDSLSFVSGEAERLAKEVYAMVKGNLYSGWNQNPAIKKLVERKVREFLAEIKPKYKISYEQYDKLHKQIFELILDYA
jgi:type I restriction enzyme R subunit